MRASIQDVARGRGDVARAGLRPLQDVAQSNGVGVDVVRARYERHDLLVDGQFQVHLEGAARLQQLVRRRRADRRRADRGGADRGG